MTDLQKAVEGSFLIDPKDIRELMFFTKKYPNSIEHSVKLSKSIYPDLLEYCDLFFNNEAVMNCVDVYKRVKAYCEKQNPCYSFTIYKEFNFLKRVDRLEFFYEINRDSDKGAKDRRYEIFVKLRTDIKFITKFLSRQAHSSQTQYPKYIVDLLSTDDSY